jgi:hypothetical protein
MNATTKKSYELILKSPGLSDKVKLDIRMNKRDLLFLARMIDYILAAEIKKDEELLALLPEETRAELKSVKTEMLKKAGLEEFYEELVQIG